MSDNFLYSLNSKEGMRLYYACKERFSEKLQDRDNFIKQITNSLKEKLKNFDTIVIPQSSNDFLFKVCSGLNKKIIVINKNSIDYIYNHMDSLNLQKKEKSAHLERFKEMGEVFKINSLKSNQRRKYQHLLFEKVQIEEISKTIILDDSCFSGTTLNALEDSTGVKNSFFIFSK